MSLKVLLGPEAANMISETSTLYFNATIITVNATRDILLDGAILVTGNRIAAIGKTRALSSNLPDGTKHVDLEAKIVLPGLINAHAHVAQSLMKGLAEDMDLHTWACDAVWPLEACYRDKDGYVAARLAVAEMLKSGTTCFLEPMLPSSAGFENVVMAVEESGIRACVGKLVKSAKPNTAAGEAFSDACDKDAASMSIEAALSDHIQYHGSLEDRLHVWIAAETPRGADEKFYAAVGKACAENSVRLTVHVAEAARDLELIRECYKASPVEFCENNGLTGRSSVFAHMCHLELDKDLDILVRTGTSVAHNPTSNCKLADGIASIPQMLEKGINVALGTDGGPCSNTYDLFRDMHLAGIIHKGKMTDASLLLAEQVLEMATINGAKALGLEKDIGSLEVGKKADFIVVNPGSLGSIPYDMNQVGKGGMHPSTVVVHSCSGRDVEIVVVDGKVVVESGILLTLDEHTVKREAQEAVSRIREKSGVTAQPLKRSWRYT